MSVIHVVVETDLLIQVVDFAVALCFCLCEFLFPNCGLLSLDLYLKSISPAVSFQDLADNWSFCFMPARFRTSSAITKGRVAYAQCAPVWTCSPLYICICIVVIFASGFVTAIAYLLSWESGDEL